MISGHVVDNITAIKLFWNSLLYSFLRSHYLCRHATRPLPTNGSSNLTASLSRFYPVTVTVPSAELFRAKFSVGRLNRQVIAGVLSVTHVVPTPRHNKNTRKYCCLFFKGRDSYHVEGSNTCCSLNSEMISSK